ncbi:MAG: ABC transporter ATP-binding protein/permease [Clostridia bacterium]|nr:ABC transporter ATP-binding protein/permease [Clostridia bacterium]
MLQIKNISKTYRTGSLTQRALDDVSLSLRDSEFVAILGQSGSGKTTLLNVIGGLDRYDEGDLLINGVSTKKYKSRDWDAYRNHSVGFVFQSYNLIPHQNILANVELALTIGGVSKRERTARAKEALDKVGLTEHIHKKPSQLSGGQMQRVAIARALVNDPDILLADEPTGALDSETSIQVMDLLKEVASDRLVVMVTHNPELAEKYATRIVRLKDGQIISDSDPYEPDGAEKTHKAGKSGMSFITALNLSLKNLWTKKVRTLLVAFAGSIGIIGIAMILSMSNGANVYIRNIQEDTLKSYPLQITKTSFDISSLISPRAERSKDSGDDGEEGVVREWRAVTSMFSRVSTNDLKSLKQYLDSGVTNINDFVQAIEYDYNVTPQIFSYRNGTVRQVNPDRTFSALGFSATDTMSSLMTSFSSTSSFFGLPADPDLYVDQYEVKAGRWPENYNECVLFLSDTGYVADLTLYTLGLKDPADLDEMVKAFAEGYASNVKLTTRKYSYDEFLGITFKLVDPSSWYVYDKDYGIWTDRSGDEAFMKRLVENGEDLTVVGVVQPAEGVDNTSMKMGIGYPASLTLHMIENASKTEIVKQQLDDPETDVFTGIKFGETNNNGSFDLSALFTVNEDALGKLFSFDPSSFSPDSIPLDMSSLNLSGLDLSSLIDLSALGNIKLPDLDTEDFISLLGSLKFNFNEEDLSKLFSDLASGLAEYAAKDPSTDFSRFPESISEYLSSGEAMRTLREEITKAFEENGAALVTTDDVSEIARSITDGFPEYAEEREAEGLTLAQLLYDYLNTDEVKGIVADSADRIRAKIAGFTINEDQAKVITAALYDSYVKYASENSLPEPSSLTAVMIEYMNSDEARKMITDAVSKMVDTSGLERKISELMAEYTSAAAPQIEEAAKGLVGDLMKNLSGTLGKVINDAVSKMASNLTDTFKFDPKMLSEAVTFNMSAEELRDMMTTLLTGETGSFETNLKKLGYADLSDPASVTIYPTDFNGKTEVKNILDAYNSKMEDAGESEKVIVYTDLVDTLMSSVTDIINAISYILIAFVAISLVVSSVMIGVITYISVLERKKEIGILRAIGASKRNVSNVFNAETFIIGLLAGVLGIVITLILLIPANYLIHTLSGQTGINAILPPVAAILLILLSVLLTLIGGIIPSRKAAKSDPVEALRSE